MKNIYAYLIGLLTLFGIATALPTYGQLNVTTGSTGADVINYLQGQGVVISNVVINCPNGAWGQYNFGGANELTPQQLAGFSNQGLLMTTGRVTDVPQSATGFASFDNPGGAAAILGASTFDACLITFNFMSICQDQVRFKYSFGSEEYPEYVGSQFNDRFGFFVCGGAFGACPPNNTQDVSCIPPTPTPPGCNSNVTINNVNGGSNPFYYQDNTFGGNVVYDGFTRQLEVIMNVVPLTTYTITLAIADVADGIFDSGVFISPFSTPPSVLTILNNVDVPSPACPGACFPSQFSSDCTLQNYWMQLSGPGGVFAPIPPPGALPPGDPRPALGVAGNVGIWSGGAATDGGITVCLPPNTAPGVYQVRAVGYLNNGGSYTVITGQPSVITINVPPNPCTFTVDNPNICQGQCTGFTRTNTPPAGTTFAWDFGAGATPATSTNPNPGSVCYNTSGTKTVTLVSTIPPTTSTSSPTTFSSSTTSNINDGCGAAVVPIPVFSQPVLTNAAAITVTVNITHTFDADIQIYLVSPDGKILELSTGNGGAGDNYAGTVFATGFPNITGGAAPFSGTFSPEGTLAVGSCGTGGTITNFAGFNGTAPNGNWQLIVRDGAGGDVGVINNWSITLPGFTINNPACVSTCTQNFTVSPGPTVTINPLGPFCASNTTPQALSASQTGGTFSGTGVSGGNFTPSIAGAGTFTITYGGTVGPCAYTTTRTVTVDPAPTPSFTALGPFCVSNTTPQALTATPAGGTFAGTGVSAGNFTPSSAGAGTFTLTYSGTVGTCNYSITRAVTVNPLPNPTFSALGPFCATNSTSQALTATPAGGTFAGSGVSGSNFTPSSAGAGTFTLTYSGSVGPCAYSITRAVTVDPAPSPTFTAIGPFCVSNTTPQPLTATPAGGTFAGTGVSAGNFTPSLAGAGTFTLTYSGTVGTCNYSITQPVTVSSQIASTFNALGPFCVSNTSPQALSGTPAGGTFAGTGVSAGNFTPSLAGVGTFTLTYSGSVGTCNYSTTQTVTVDPLPNPTFSALGPFCASNGTAQALTATPAGGTFSGTGVTGTNFTPSSAGAGTITLTYSGAVGTCNYSVTRTVTVDPVPNPTFSALGPFCINNTTPQALTATPAGGTFAGTGVSGSNFTPSNAGAGTFTLTYSGSVGTCNYSVTRTVTVDPLPNPTFSALGPFCVSNTTPQALTATPAGGIFAGTGVTGTNFTPSSAGAGTFTLTYSGGVGTCNYSITRTVTVDPAPNATFSALGPFCVSNTSPQALTATPAGGTFAGTGVTGSNFTPSNAGAGTFTLTYSGSVGTCNYSVTRTVTVDPLPNPTFSALGPFCINNSVPQPLTATPAGGTFAGMGVTGSNFTPSNAGAGTFTLTYSGSVLTCNYSVTRTVTVDPLPNPTFSALGPFCVSNVTPQALTAIPAGGTFAGTGVSGSNFTPSSAGAGTFTLTYSGGVGTCTYSVTRTVTVDPQPTPTFSALGPFCVTNTTPQALTATPTGGTFTGSGVSGTNFTPSIAGAGTFTLTYSGNVLTCNYSITRAVTVDAQPNPTFSALGPFCVSNTTPQALTATPVGGTFAGTGVSGTNFTPSIAGAGTFTLTYSGSVGTCAYSITRTVTVDAQPNPTFTALGPFCVSNTTPQALTATPAGGTFTGSGVSGSNFTPSIAGAGTFTLTYSGGVGTCNYSVTRTVTVDPQPNPTFNALGPFCVSNTSPQALVATPAGGTFAGSGVSGSNFTPSNAGAGTFTLTYSGNVLTCTYSVTRTVTVDAQPVPTFTALGTFCVSNTTPQPLVATPAGGTFSGTGVSGTNFTPSVAGIGTFTLTYSGNVGTCTYSITRTVTVDLQPVPTFSALGPFCVTNTTPQALTGTPAGGTFAGTGVSGTNFTPSNAGAGTFTLTYSGGVGTCTYSTTRTVTVDPQPTPTFSALGPFCVSNTSPQALTATPAGGTFAGTGVSGTNFTPSNAGVGTFTLTYSGNVLTCNYSVTRTVTVDPQPTPTFSALGPFCVSNSIAQPLTATPAGGTFGGSGVVGSNFTPSNAGAGTFTLTYSGSVLTCNYSVTRTVTVDPQPNPTFNALGPFCVSNTTPQALVAAPAGGTFAGTGVSGSNFTPSNAGTGTFTLTYSGSVLTCNYSVTRTVTVDPQPIPTFTALGPFCVSNTTPQALVATPAGGTFAGTGVTGANFTPSIAGTGTFTLTYSGNVLTCSYSTTQTVTVDVLPIPTFTQPGPFCITDNTPQPLTATPAGGVFAGTGVSGSNFTPSNAGVGTFTLTYSGGVGTCTYSTTQTTTVRPTPTATLTGSATICAGNTATFNVTLANVEVGDTWTLTYFDGVANATVTGVSSGTTSITTAALSTNAIITLVSLTNTNCPATVSGTASVTVNPLPVPIASNDGPLCVGGTLNLGVTAGPAGTLYTWTGPNSYNASGQNVTRPGLTLADAGVYSVTVAVPGCNGVPTTTTVAISAPANPVAINNGPLCVSGTLNLSVNADIAGTTYQWAGPTLFNSPLQNPTRPGLTLADAGTYSVTVTTPGCVGVTATTNVVVNPAPIPTIVSNSPVCVGNAILLTVNVQAGVTTVTSGPNGYSSALLAQTINNATLAMAGTYTVAASVAGCPAVTASTNVVVNEPPIPTITSNDPVCVGNSILLTVGGFLPLGINCMINGPLGFTVIGLNATRSNANLFFAGVYTVTATRPGCAPVTASTTVAVNAPANPQPTNNSVICVGSTLQLTVNPEVAGSTYSWTGPNVFSSALQNPSRPGVTLADAGTYSVTVATPGCSGVVGTTLVVINAPYTPVASNNSVLCTTQTLQLTASSGMAGTTYSWSGPNSFSSALQNPTLANVTLADAGVYVVTATVPTCSGVTASTTVVINAPPPVSNTNLGPICTGGTINLTAVNPPAGVIYTYAWQGPLSFTSTLQNPSIPNVTTANAGVYSVTITVAGCSPTVSTVNVSVAPPPVLTPSSNSPLCQGQVLNLSVNTVAGANYAWTGPLGYNNTLQNPAISSAMPAMSGVYSVTATVPGCTPVSGTTTVLVNPTPPAPSLSQNGPICAEQTLLLSASTIPNATYQWNGPNSFQSNLQNPSIPNVTVAAGGTYQAFVTVNGCTGPIASINVTIYPIPAQPVVFNNGPICAGQTLQLTGPAVTGATYNWTGPNNFVSNVQSPIFPSALTNISGVYSLIVTVNGCISPAGTTTVLVKPVPLTPTIGNNGPLCLNTALQLTSSDGSPASYNWTGPNAFTSNVQNPVINSVTSSNAGLYSLTLSLNGCTSPPASTNVVIFPAPATAVAANNGPICAGQTLQLTASNVPGAVYSWTGPNNFTSALQNPVINNAQTNQSGTYVVTVVTNGCLSAAKSATTQVIVKPVPVAPNIGNNGPVCVGEAINLTAEPVPGAVYQWTGPQTFVSATPNPTIAPVSSVNAGVYYLLINLNGCLSNAVSTTVIVYPKPDVPSVSNNGPLCANQTLQLSAANVSGATYLWTGPNGFGSALQNPQITNVSLAQSGGYSLTVTVNGCTSETGITQVVVSPPPTTPAPGNNGPICVGATLQLTAGTSSGATYLWNGPNNFTSTQQNPVITNVTAQAAGTYSLIVSVGNCVSNVGTTLVDVISTPSANVVLSNNGPMCVGATLQLTATNVPNATYMWTGPNGFNTYTQNPSLPAVQTFNAGNYSLTVTVGQCVVTQQSTNVVVKPLPATPSVGNNGPICLGQTIQFTASGISGVSYNWVGPNAYSSTLQNPTRVIASITDLGAYTLTVSTTDLGCVSLAASTVVTANGAVSTPVPGNNGPLCVGQTLLLAVPTVAGATYSWSGANGFTSTQQNPTVSNNAGVQHAGTYSVRVTVGGCTSPAGTTTVVVNPKPANPFPSSNGPVCAGFPLDFFVNVISGATYLWTGPLGYMSAQDQPIIANPTVSQSGTYTVTATMNGCTSLPATLSVTVKPSPSSPSAGNNSPLCAGQTLQLTASTIAGATYQWNGPNGFATNVKNPSIGGASVSASGVYSVTATVNGCTSPAGLTTVFINGAGAIPTVGSNSPVCVGQTLMLSAAMIPGGTYMWTGPNGFTSNLTNPTIPNATSNQNGTYSLVVTTSGCTSSVATVNVSINAAPSAPSAGNNGPICAGQTLQLSASTVTNAVYHWTGPNGFVSSLQNPMIPAVNALNAGVYSVSLTLNGCNSPVGTTTVVINGAAQTPTASSNAPLCINGATPTTLNLFGGFVAGATYAWTGPNGFDSNLQNPVIVNAGTQNAGVYSLNISVAGCSSASTTTSVAIYPRPSINNISNSGPICEGQNLQLTAVSGAGATYQWTGPNGFNSGNQNPMIISAMTAATGSYIVTVTQNGCTATASTNAQIKPVPAPPTASNNGPLCAGATLNLTATGASNATYQWSGPNAYVSTAQNPTIVGASAANTGVYSVTATLNGCTSASVTTSVTIVSLPSAPIMTSNSPVCEGQSLQLTTTAVSGATYQWSGPGGFQSNGQNPTIPNVSSLNAGVYSLMVTISGCSSAQGTLSVTVKPTPSAPLAGNSGPVCAGQTINLTASSIPNGTYSWSGPNNFSSTFQNPTISNVGVGENGTYGVFVTVNGCQSAASSTTVVVNPTPLAPSIANNGPLCLGATLNLSATPISGAVYSWNGPNNFASVQQNPSISNVGTQNAGLYSVFATVNGCKSATGTTSVVINAVPSAPTVGNNGPICAGQTLNLTANGGAGVSYLWSGPGFSSALQNPTIPSASALNSGVYSVVVSANGCASALSTTNVTVNASPNTPTITANAPICAGSALQLNTNPVPGALYSWTGPNGFNSSAVNPIILNVSANASGIYSLRVTVNGCSSPVGTMNITVNPVPAAPTATSNNPVCSGNTIQLTASTVSGATYFWIGPNGFSSNQQNSVINNAFALNSGTYQVRVTVNGCNSTFASTTVTIRNTPAAPSAGSNAPLCVGQTLAFTAQLVSGATYSWTGPNGFVSNQQNPVIANVGAANAGVYSVKVTVGGCNSAVSTVSVTINAASTLTAGNNGPICAGQTVSLTASNLIGAIYNWVGPNGFSSTQQNTAFTATTANQSGVYTVTATVGACVSTATTTLGVQVLPAVTASVNSPLCAGATATFNVTTVSGATYSWVGPNGFTSAQQNPIITNVSTASSGVYTVTVTSGVCSRVLTVTLNATINAPTPTVSNNGPVCSGGTLQLNASFINGATYLWTGPNGFVSTQQNPVISNAQTIHTGVYTTVITVNGCGSASATSIAIVNQTPAAPVANNNGPICAGNTLQFTANTVAGATFSWTGPNAFTANVQNPNLSNVTTANSGVYSVTVTVNGCNSTPAVTNVTINALPNAPVVSNNSPICAGQTLNLTANFISGATYMWSGPNGFSSNIQNPVINNVPANVSGVYTLNITLNGCSAQNTTTVTVNALLGSPTLSSNAPICAGTTLDLSASFISGATYMWTGPNGFSSNVQNPVINNVPANASGVYSCVVTKNGCTSAQATLSVTVKPFPVLTSAGNNAPICAGQTLQLSTNNLSGASYQWSGPNNFSSNQQNPVISNAQATNSGVYFVTATVNSCTSASVASSVTINAIPQAPTVTTNAPLCAGSTLTLSVNTVTGQTYAWLGPNGFTSASATVNVPNVSASNAGAYVVTATENGCTSSPALITVTVFDLPTATLSGGGNSCAGLTVTLPLTLTGKGPWTLTYTENTSQQTLVVGNSASTSPFSSNLTVTPTVNSTYTLTSVIDGNGCANTLNETVVRTVRPAPTATISGTASICPGGTANMPITLTGSGGPWTVTYMIDGVGQSPVTLGGSVSPSPGTFNIPVSQGGTYSIAIVTDGAGCTGVGSGVFGLNILPAPEATFNVSQLSVCPSSPVFLPLTLTGQGPWTVHYNTNGVPQSVLLGSANAPSPFVTTIAVSPTTSSTYQLTQVISGNGCTSVENSTLVVTMLALPTATWATSSIDVCSGQTANLPLALTGVGPWTVQYTRNDVMQTPMTVGSANSPSPTTVTLPFSANGADSYQLVSVTDANGCTNGASTRVSVNVIPTPTATLSGGGTLCGGAGVVALTVNCTGQGPWTVGYAANGLAQAPLTFGTANSPSPSSFTLTVAPTTNTSYQLTSVTGAGGCDGTVSGNANVTVVTGTATATVSTVTTTTTTVSWNAVSGAIGYEVRYRPVGATNFTTISNISGTSVDISGLTAGITYEVQVGIVCLPGTSPTFGGTTNFTTPADPSGCATPTNVTVTPLSPTSANVSWNAVASGAVCYLISYGPTNVSENAWTTVLAPHPNTSIVINNLLAGVTYGVRVRTNCTLCSSRSGVRSTPSAAVTFTTPTSKGAAETTAVRATQNLTVYPNPNRGLFTVSFEASDEFNAEIEIYDVTGRLIQQKAFQTARGLNEASIDLTRQAAGIYQVKCTLNDGVRLIKVAVN